MDEASLLSLLHTSDRVSKTLKSKRMTKKQIVYFRNLQHIKIKLILSSVFPKSLICNA